MIEQNYTKEFDFKTDRYQLVQEMNETVTNQTVMLTELKQIAQLKETIDERNRTLQNLNETSEDNVQLIEDRNKTLQFNSIQLTNGQQKLKDLDELIHKLNRNRTGQQLLRSYLTTKIASQKQSMDDANRRHQQQTNALQNDDRAINNLTETIRSIKSTVDNGTCYKPECLATSATLIQSMDTTADPCNDFFQFACGGFLSRNPLPDQKFGQLRFEVLRDEVMSLIRGTALTFFRCNF
jgi:Peptidase family M13